MNDMKLNHDELIKQGLVKADDRRTYWFPDYPYITLLEVIYGDGNGIGEYIISMIPFGHPVVPVQAGDGNLLRVKDIQDLKLLYIGLSYKASIDVEFKIGGKPFGVIKKDGRAYRV